MENYEFVRTEIGQKELVMQCEDLCKVLHCI